MKPVRAKKHRLPDAAYRGNEIVCFTANVEDRRPLFRDAEVVSAMVAELEQQMTKFDCLVPVYCFMPDHLHLVVGGQSARSDAKAAMDAFKTQTGLWLGQHRPGWFWQDDYYDHLIRHRDDWRRQVFYAYTNPVRKRLIDHPADWPHTGSIGFDLQELLLDMTF